MSVGLFGLAFSCLVGWDMKKGIALPLPSTPVARADIYCEAESILRPSFQMRKPRPRDVNTYPRQTEV